MNRPNSYLLSFCFAAFLVFTLGANSTLAQDPGSYHAEREKAIGLINQKKFSESIPLLEKLAINTEADGQVFLGLGLAYWNLQDPDDPAKFKPFRLKAKTAFLKAKELGVSIPEIDLIVASIKPDGGDRGTLDDPEAQAAMSEADSLFMGGDYKKAVVAYEKAATLDPTHYEASLYTGNTYYSLKEYDKAGVWFAKAIAIDPDRETSYRYWADALYHSGKDSQAVDKYHDAIIAEPYSSAAWRGLNQYGQRKNIKLSHPKIDVPVEFSASEGGNTKITLGNLLNKSDDGSFAWTMYGLSRALWQTDKDGKLSEKFSRAYPTEKVYRHSLAEERDAFRSVLTVLKESKDAKKPQASLVMLRKLEAEGLLDAYILFARATAGVSKDYPAYRTNNRALLKRYLSEYVMKNGGS